MGNIAKTFLSGSIAILLAVVTPMQADQLETTAGDRLVGRTLSVTDHIVVFQSEKLGKISIARSNVASLMLTRTNSSVVTSSPSAPAAAGDLASILKALPSSTNLTQNTSAELLSQAGPEAAQKFNELLRGLMTGKMSVADLRAEAKSVADETRALRSELGEEGALLDGYLSILDRFLAQTPSSKTSAPPVSPAPAR